MSTDAPPTPRRSFDALLFDVILVGFSGVLVFNSFGLRAGVGTVPLLVGIPTLILSAGILLVDLFPGLRPARTAKESSSGLQLQALMAAAKESEDDLELGNAPNERRRQFAFAAWSLGVVVLATVTSFYVALPVGLVVLFVAIRLPLVTSALTLAVTLALFYGLFDVFLGVRF